MKSIGFCLLPTCLILCCGCGRSPEARTIVIRAPGSLEVTHATDRVQIIDGPERKIEIKEDEHGIDITVTKIHLAADAKGNMDYKDGEQVTKKYKDAAELEKENPDLYRFYKDYAGNLDWRRHFKVLDQGGLAGLQFEHWVLAFEAVPAQSVPIGLNTANVLPRALADFQAAKDGTPGKRDSTQPILIEAKSKFGIQARVGDLHVSSWLRNSMSVNGCRFEFTDGGKKLAFAAPTYEVRDDGSILGTRVGKKLVYEAAETPKTIVISKDGKTPEQANK